MHAASVDIISLSARKSRSQPSLHYLVASLKTFGGNNERLALTRSSEALGDSPGIPEWRLRCV